MGVVHEFVLDTKFGEVATDLRTDFGFFWVEIAVCFYWVCLEVCFSVPSFGGGAVCHAEDAVFWLQFSFDYVDPHSDDACHVF